MINKKDKIYKNLWSITKPGIIFGNAITVMGGFFLGIGPYNSHYGIHLVQLPDSPNTIANTLTLSQSLNSFLLFFVTLLGISLIIASGCVFNNCIDRDIDKIMQRTKKRVLACGLISVRLAIIYAIMLGVLGAGILYIFTNLLAVALALVGLFVYVVVYSLWLKRNSIHATIIGSISGAIPPVVGYCAATNSFDAGAVILFVMLSIWQIPHSFAIAIYRFSDYANAGIPVLPVKKGVGLAKVQMLIYVILFSVVSVMLSVFGYAGFIYFIIATIVGLSWIKLSLQGFKIKDKFTGNAKNQGNPDGNGVNDVNTANSIWAKKMFGFSILAITVLSITMALDAGGLR